MVDPAAQMDPGPCSPRDPGSLFSFSATGNRCHLKAGFPPGSQQQLGPAVSLFRSSNLLSTTAEQEA